MRQLSRQDSNSTSSDDDGEDRTDAKYKHFKNQSERGSQKSTASEIDQSTIGEFINPVFKPAENDKDKQFYDTPKTDYDSLSFSNNTENNNQQSPASKKPTQKTRTDITKPPEEYEMGVSNYGYHNENPRPDSWNKSLSFSPYAVDTPIGGPTEHRGSALSIPAKRQSGSSKHSDYSFMSADPENPYAAPSDKISVYDTIPGQELAQKGQLPPPRQSTKKANLAYESAVIKHTQVHRETMKPDNPKEGYAEDEHSNCCHTIFIVLVGIIALIALVMCFLLVFGTISVKKCKECDMVDVPRTAQQTGGNSGNNDALLREIETLRKNITALHETLSKMSKPENQTDKIVLLENELAGQRIQVASLTDELAKQKNVTKTLDQTTKNLRNQVQQNKFKMVELNTTLFKRHISIAQSLNKVQSELTQNLTQTGKNIANIQVNLTMDLHQMTRELREDMKKKISVSNFTKLIKDSQGVVDELYRMINTSSYKQNKLNETIRMLTSSVYDSLTNQIKVLSNSSSSLKHNMTLYGEMYLNLKNTSVSACKFANVKRFKDFPGSGNPTVTQKATANPDANMRIVSASCDASADIVQLKEGDSAGSYLCECTSTKKNNELGFYCTIHYLYCPI